MVIGTDMKEVLFFWNGLTAYGARALEALRKSYGGVRVVAVRSSFPYKGIEQLFGGEIVWVEPSETRTLKELCGDRYGIVFTSGWNEPIFNRFSFEARSAGRPVVCCVDNNWGFTAKMVLWVIRFRLMQRRQFDAFFVPGASGIKLLRMCGVPRARIVTGFYAGDTATFASDRPMVERENRIVCVGQLNARKNVVAVAKAFLKISERIPGWTLEFCGRGPDRDKIPEAENIVVTDFLQPLELAKKYQTAKVFILASLEEHWGVVVHEAALAGCALLLSKRVGALPDFLTERNGASFDPTNVHSIVRAMERVMRWGIKDFDTAQQISLARAAAFGGNVFTESALEIARRLGGSDVSDW